MIIFAAERHWYNNIWVVLATAAFAKQCVAGRPAKHCRHILTVIKITPTTCSLWQCHQHWPMSSAGIESVLCVIVNMAEKQIGQFPKKKRNSWRTSFLNTARTIPRCQVAFANGDDFVSLKYHQCLICPQISVLRCIFDLNAHNDNKRIDREEWARQRAEIHPLLPAYTCDDYRPSTRASLDFKCVCRICKFARVSGGEAMKEKAKRKKNGRKTTIKSCLFGPPTQVCP